MNIHDFLNFIREGLDFGESSAVSSEESDYPASSESEEDVSDGDSSSQTKPNVVDHCIKSYTKIHEFFVVNKYTDVDIRCQTRVFKCHRMVLAAASDYFDTMFSESLGEKYTNEVSLPDIDPDTFQEILRFAYEGNVQINDCNVFDLWYASEYLLLDNFIEDKCIEYLREQGIPWHYAIDLFLFACATYKSILRRLVGMFVLHNLEYFTHRADFLEIPHEEFDTLLSYFRSCMGESKLARAVLLWISHRDVNPYESNKDAFMKLTRNINFVLKTAEEYYEQTEWPGAVEQSDCRL